MTVIDVHTHMLDEGWLRLLREKAPPRYEVGAITADLEGIYRDGALFMTPRPGHFDYDLRVRDMDRILEPLLDSIDDAVVGHIVAGVPGSTMANAAEASAASSMESCHRSATPWQQKPSRIGNANFPTLHGSPENRHREFAGTG